MRKRKVSACFLTALNLQSYIQLVVTLIHHCGPTSTSFSGSQPCLYRQCLRSEMARKWRGETSAQPVFASKAHFGNTAVLPSDDPLQMSLGMRG